VFEKAGRASKRLTTVESMIAGAIAGSATVLLTNPIWVVNTRMTTRKQTEGSEAKKAPTTIGTLLALLREEGLQALFAGVVPALVLVINPILQYTIFEQLKNILEKKKRITPTVAFMLGALGKLFATSITYPYITVKSQMHVAGREGGKGNMLAAMRGIIKEEGYAGLYKGDCPFTMMCLHCINEHQALDPKFPKVFSLQRSCSHLRTFCTTRLSNYVRRSQRRYLPSKCTSCLTVAVWGFRINIHILQRWRMQDCKRKLCA
jgi:Mitochondrial carrier protein